MPRTKLGTEVATVARRLVPNCSELKEIAASANLSEYHFQTLFTRWVGISPNAFLQFLTKERAKELLEKSARCAGCGLRNGAVRPGALARFVRRRAKR